MSTGSSVGRSGPRAGEMGFISAMIALWVAVLISLARLVVADVRFVLYRSSQLGFVFRRL